MISTREDICKDLGLVYCSNCGYCNKAEMVAKYGTCKRCNITLDDKAKFKYEMNKHLRLWRSDKNKRRNYFIEGD